MNATPVVLSRVGNIMLGVADVGRAVEFYRDRLGLTLQHQFPGFAFFGGGVTLVLSEPLRKARPETGGAVEVVFAVDSVREAREALGARGVVFTTEPRNVTGNLWAATFDDPEGHHLSIFGPEQKTV